MPTATLKCRGCKERFPRDQMIKINSGNFHSYDCATQYAREKSLVQKANILKKKRKAFDAETRSRKKELNANNLGWQHKQTEKSVNRLVRIRDYGKPCISCGNPNQNIKIDAGHYKSVGAFPELRYNLKNINGQCSLNCNQHLSGNRAGYDKGIVERFGQDRLDYLTGHHDRIKYTCEDLEKFRFEVNQIIREIEAGGEFREPSMYQ